jgi:hypothetical protein
MSPNISNSVIPAFLEKLKQLAQVASLLKASLSVASRKSEAWDIEKN